MTAAEVDRRVAEAKAYAADHGLKYLPAFRRMAANQPWFDEPMPGWKSVKLLEDLKLVEAGTFARWRRGHRVLDGYSWCPVCVDAPIASAAGLCIWCEHAPVGAAA